MQCFHHYLSNTADLSEREKMAEKEKPKNIFSFKDEKPAPFDCKYTTTIRDQHVPLIVDNGNYTPDIQSEMQQEHIVKSVIIISLFMSCHMPSRISKDFAMFHIFSSCPFIPAMHTVKLITKDHTHKKIQDCACCQIVFVSGLKN